MNIGMRKPSRHIKFELAAFAAVFAAAYVVPVSAAPPTPVENGLQYQDVFNLEYATAPQASPDGQSVYYERRSMDIMTDRIGTNIWTVDLDGGHHRAVLSGKAQYRMPRFSPDGTRLAYLSNEDGKTQIYIRWLDSGDTTRVTNLDRSPSNISWSPDGKQIAFTMFVPGEGPSLFRMPAQKPKDAKWAPDVGVTDKLTIRRNGSPGYVPYGFTHVFVVPTDGGTPRQVTDGPYNHNGSISWVPGSDAILISANRRENWDRDRGESEVYRVNLTDGSTAMLTNRDGPDGSPVVSPRGDLVAYTGNDDDGLTQQNRDLYVMNMDGSGVRNLTAGLDRSVGNVQWNADGTGLYYSYVTSGKRVVAFTNLAGNGRVITEELGGTSLGRPYAGGTYGVMPDGRIVFTQRRTDRPADLAVIDRIGSVTTLTDLNGDVIGHRRMATVERIAANSSVDGREVEGWVAKPAGFDPSKKYPLILEIHGGPFSAYGPMYSSEIQLMAAQGYMVLFANPRGSTSYGADFANLIHQNYPSEDYNDLMDLVDTTIAQGSVDEDQLYVTGGSAGGIMTAWIVGKTNRFRAAVVAKPVINWTSLVLTSDAGVGTVQTWFSDMPWNVPEEYWESSPLSLVGNVTTPTMVLVGTTDYRTPASEAEQYYTALRLKGVPTTLVTMPNTDHGLASRPSNLIRKVGNIIGWFKKYEGATPAD